VTLSSRTGVVGCHHASECRVDCSTVD
jgi:hypothetical protein